MKLLVLSDTHHGRPTQVGDYFEQALEVTEQQSVDVVLHLGDIMHDPLCLPEGLERLKQIPLAKDAIVQGVKVSAPTSTTVLDPSTNIIRVLLYLGDYQIPIVTTTQFSSTDGFCLSPSNLAQFSSCGAYIPAETYTMKMYIAVMDSNLSIPMDITTLQQANISLSLAYLSVA